MYQSITPAQSDALLVDPETGVVLQDPPHVKVTTRYLSSHPFIERVGRNIFVAGPDAGLAATGRANDGNYAEYVITGGDDGPDGTLAARKIA